MDVLGGGERDGLVVFVTCDGHGYANVLADGELDGDIPLVLELAAEPGEESGGLFKG